MGSRLKEDEKNERIIRGLLKQPGNRKCINCKALGPQYVCTTFSTFVCTTCGGIHREFTHRVKSVSMAKFTPQEIASLQAGGNECAQEIFFKDWDPQRPAPDSRNVDKLRDWIKHVYVDKLYTGERSVDRPPRSKMGDKEEPTENRKSDSYQSGSRSPPFDEAYERRHSASPGYDGRRSPGYDLDNQRHSDYGRSPVRSGLVNDWRREDRFSNGKRSEDRRSFDGEHKPEIRSPDSQKDSSLSSPPAGRPVRDILGENVTPLRISEPPRTSNSRVSDGAKIAQRAASSSSLSSSNGNPTGLKRETSLIDFDAAAEPAAASVAQDQPSTASKSVVQSTSTPSDDNWACFDHVSEEKVAQAPPSTNPLESMLTELSVPTPAPVSGSTGGGFAPTQSNSMFPSSTSGDLLFDSVGSTSMMPLPGATATSQLGSLSSFSSGGVAPGPGLAPTAPVNGGISQWPGVLSQQQSSTASVNQPIGPQFSSAFPSGLSSQGAAGNPMAQASQVLQAVAQAPQGLPTPAAQTAEANVNARKELPADLFTFTYNSVPNPYQGHGWQGGLAPGMGFHMQYNTAMSMPTFPQPIKSSNPFDANAGASPGQAAAFPSMSSLHAALPNMGAPGGSMHASNVGSARPSWIPPQLATYPSAMPSHAPSVGSVIPGPYMGQQLHSNTAPSRPQGLGSFGSEGTAFGSLNPAAATPNPSPGGNPFG